MGFRCRSSAANCTAPPGTPLSARPSRQERPGNAGAGDRNPQPPRRGRNPSRAAPSSWRSPPPPAVGTGRAGVSLDRALLGAVPPSASGTCFKAAPPGRGRTELGSPKGPSSGASPRTGRFPRPLGGSTGLSRGPDLARARPGLFSPLSTRCGCSKRPRCVTPPPRWCSFPRRGPGEPGSRRRRGGLGAAGGGPGPAAGPGGERAL